MSREMRMRREMMLGVVDEQMRIDDPKETRVTFRRLVGAGHTEEEAREMIAVAIVEELYDMLKAKETFNEGRYVSRLRALK